MLMGPAAVKQISQTRSARHVGAAARTTSGGESADFEDLMTVAEFLDLVRVARTTFDDWRAKKRAPKCIKLPNGQLRIRHRDYTRWLDQLDEA